jgi:hypothetical protein
MSNRQNFSPVQRQSAFAANAEWLRDHRVDGVEIEERYRHLRERGEIYYCENCLFCHTDPSFFDVDHLVPDRSFRVWGVHADARSAINMVILCKSVRRGDFGCNQSKGSSHYVPESRGLAFSRAHLDMNYVRLNERPFDWAKR